MHLLRVDKDTAVNILNVSVLSCVFAKKETQENLQVLKIRRDRLTKDCGRKVSKSVCEANTFCNCKTNRIIVNFKL